jgi:hypothetical protein
METWVTFFGERLPGLTTNFVRLLAKLRPPLLPRCSSNHPCCADTRALHTGLAHPSAYLPASGATARAMSEDRRYIFNFLKCSVIATGFAL